MRNFSPFPSPARIGLLGVAFDENSSYLPGAALAPQQIRKAFFSDSSNLWTENGTDLGSDGIFADMGDIRPSAEQMPIETEQAAERIHLAQMKVIAFGGDHSVTYPLVNAAAKHHPNLTILHFDAHPDLYDTFEGNPYSHACPMARIMEAGLAKRLVQVGIRTMNGHQREQAQRFNVEVLTMQEWHDVFQLKLDAPLYLTFDMDCLDPAFAPGVSHREPGGLSTREVLRVIQSLTADIIGADVVELNPAQDPLFLTEMVAAKVFKEITAKML